MILYRKVKALRVRRSAAPEPPFWCATALAPYSPRRAEPVAIDYLALRAGSAGRLEVTVTTDVAEELERGATLEGPVLIEATERAEAVFGRGGELLRWCAAESLDSLLLLSVEDVLPPEATPHSVVTIAAWPPEPDRLEALFAEAGRRGLTWGVLVPVLYPITTELPLLETIADAAARHGARFLTGAAMELEPTARQAMARSLSLEAEDDRYSLLFHGRVEPVALATERHLAALAGERSMDDAVTLSPRDARSNWCGATLLARTASRMMAMELDLDLAGHLARAARAVAALDKPLTRIAESASLGIVAALDETSAEMLTEWLATGRSTFADFVDDQWRARRA